MDPGTGRQSRQLHKQCKRPVRPVILGHSPGPVHRQLRTLRLFVLCNICSAPTGHLCHFKAHASGRMQCNCSALATDSACPDQGQFSGLLKYPQLTQPPDSQLILLLCSPMQTYFDQSEHFFLDCLFADISKISNIRPFQRRQCCTLRHQQSKAVIFTTGKTVSDLADSYGCPVICIDIVLRVRRQRTVRRSYAHFRLPAQVQFSYHSQAKCVLNRAVYDAPCRCGFNFVNLKLQILLRQDNRHYSPRQRWQGKTRAASSPQVLRLHHGLKLKSPGGSAGDH
ncbi:hypothetical protein ES707_19686 [subsurface metagenome]